MRKLTECSLFQYTDLWQGPGGTVLAVLAQWGCLSRQAQKGGIGCSASAWSQKAFAFQPRCPATVANASR